MGGCVDVDIGLDGWMDRWIDGYFCVPKNEDSTFEHPPALSCPAQFCPALPSVLNAESHGMHIFGVSPPRGSTHAFAHSLISTHTLGTPSHTSISHPRALHVRLLAVHHGLELIHHIPAPIPLLRTRTLRSPQRTPIQARAGDINRIRPLRPERDGSRRPARQELERHD